MPLFLLLPGFLYGVGDMLLAALRMRRGFGEAVAISLAVWSIVGWFSFGHFRGVVLLLSGIGTLWLLYVIFKNRPKVTLPLPVALFFLAILLRWMMAAFALYPYQKDFIMHTYSTATILHYNGYGPEYYPFGVSGFGAFNLGFHFTAAGLSYLTGLKPIDAVVSTVYIFWGVLFWGIYRWIKNPWISLLSIFTFHYPLNYLNWGGFPTLSALSLGLFAFKEKPSRALPYWLGAFSLHFIPVSVPFLVYLAVHRHRLKEFLPYLSMVLLIPQYYLIFKWASHMSPEETRAVDVFVVSNFPKSSAVVLFLFLLALLGYRYRRLCRAPLWGVILSVFAGVVSFVFAYLHIPINAPKSLYMSRMVLLLLPPAAFGVLYLWKKVRWATLILPIAVSSYVAYRQVSAGLDPEDWKAIHKVLGRKGWFLTSYGSEGAYLPALGSPSWKSHYIISQMDEFREAAWKNGFKYVVCDHDDPAGPTEYYREVCKMGEGHPDVDRVVAKGRNLTVYGLKRVVHPDTP